MMDFPNVLPPKNTSITMGEIYIKDASFETANTPYIFQKKKNKPTVVPNFHVTITEVEPDWFEVALTLNVTTKIGDDLAYLVEVVQAGIFHFNQISDDDKEQLLGNYCPKLLFPYAREAVSNLIQKGGFMQIPLPPIEFDANFAPVRKDTNVSESESNT